MNVIRIVLIAVALESIALAGTYDLVALLPLRSADDATLTATLTTPAPISEPMLLTTETEIEAFLNSTTYSITLGDRDGNILMVSDDENARWDLEVFEQTGSSAALLIEPTQLTLDFSTPRGSSAQLHVRGAPLGQFDYSQRNFRFGGEDGTKLTNLLAQFNAENFVNAFVDYDSPFVFPLVPEPSSIELLIVLLPFAFCIRERRQA